MRGAPTSISIKVILAALFVWVQGAALFDAASHGEQPHKHFGVSCDLTAVAAQVAPLPFVPDLPKPPLGVSAAVDQPTLDYRPWSRPPGRAPPPRSPPTLLQ